MIHDRFPEFSFPRNFFQPETLKTKESLERIKKRFKNAEFYVFISYVRFQTFHNI